jgi:hypothetical protein
MHKGKGEETGKNKEVKTEKGRNGRGRQRRIKENDNVKEEKSELGRKRYEMRTGKEGKFLDDSRSTKTFSVSQHFTIL